MINEKIKLFFLLCLFLIQSCEQKFPIQLGNDYIIDYGGNSLLIIQNYQKAIHIGSQIIAWDFDSTFIIVKQKPYYKITDSIRDKNLEITYYEMWRLYNAVYKYNYWIIDKEKELDSYYDETKKIRIYTSGLYGPLTYKEYLEKRKELDVPDSLELKEIEKWF